MPDRNILDELMRLLNQPGPVNWALASQLADHLAGSPEPIDPWLAEEYLELTRFAQMQVPTVTGVHSDPATGAVLVDRIGWTRHNLRSFSYLVEPLAAKLASSAGSGPMEAVLKPLGPALLGMQIGAMVSAMSEKALGLFDAGLPTAAPRGLVLLVTNIEAFASEHELDARQVRLWSALHEVTHDALVGRSWVRPHLIGMFEDLVGSMEFDTETMTGLHQELADPAKLEARFTRGGAFAGLFGVPPEGGALEAIGTFMAMVEGYGAHIVDRASAGLLPDLSSIRTAISSRRHDQTRPTGPLHGLFGIETEAGGAGAAVTFCAEVASRWGDAAVDRIWLRPENLPTPSELHDATGWAARVLLDDPFT